MKKTLLFFLLVTTSLSLSGQQLFFEAYSGYNLTNYDLEGFTESAGYVPIGFKIAGGHQYVQLGAEYRRHITNPEFEFELPGTAPVRHEFDETYYGAFIRGNISSLPAYRFGLILSAGLGYYKPTMEVYALDSESDPISTLEYDKKLGYNLYAGVSAPIFAQLHWEIGYCYNRVDRPENGLIAGHAGDYHMIHVGLSGNFVFGNTRKKCRRVIEMKRSGRR